MDAEKPYLIDDKYTIHDIIDLEQLRELFEKFTHATGFTIGFLDHPELNVLIGTGWRDICTKFHRGCPASAEICKKSNAQLLNQLTQPGQLIIEPCENGLVDCATPIIIKGRHIASLATGQLLLEKPDIERFRKQAKMYGFDEKKYLEALEEIPIVSERELRSMTAFLGCLASVVTELGYANLEIRGETERLEREKAERVLVEQALRMSETRSSFALERSQTGFWDLDIVDHTASRTLVHDRIFGYGSLLPRWTYEMFLEHVIPEDRAEVDRLFQKAISTQTSWDFECRIRRTDGQVRWIWATGEHQPDATGKIRRMAGIVQDITGRKHAEDALRNSEKKFRELVGTLSDVIFTLDLEGNVLDISSSLEKNLGWSPEQIIGKNFSQFLHPEDLPKAEAEFIKAIQGQGHPIEVRLLTADGKPKWVSINALLITYNDEPENLLGVITDIHEKKLAEEALRESEANYKLIFNLTPMAIAICDLEGNVTNLNDYGIKIAGFSRADVVGKSFLELTGMLDEKDLENLAEMLPSILAGKSVEPFELKIISKDDTIHWIESHIVLMKKEGKPFAIQIINRDITERKMSMEKEEKIKAMEQATKMKDAFLANMSHELRTPLNAIIGYSEVMQDELHGPLNEKQKDNMNKVLTSGKLLLSLINDILDMSKMQAGMFEVKKEPFDLGLAVKEVKDTFRENIKRKAQTLSVTVPEDLPYVNGDMLRVKQILMNLLSNAIKFSPNGGRIDLHVEKKTGELLLWVKDQGIGMTQDELKHVFEPFWQADESKVNARGGTGLGLPISKRLVDLLGGRIWFESEKGKGTTVHFILPIVAQNADEQTNQ